MQVLSDGRIRRTAPEWKEIIERFGGSELPIAAFCEKEGVSRSAFASWKKKLGTVQGPVRKKTPSFVEITSAARRKSSAPTVASSASSEISFELALPSGVTLRWKS